MVRSLILVALAATLSACSGGGGGGNPLGIICEGLAGAVPEGGSACAGNCSASFTEGAVDHDLDTYAILAAEDQASGSVRIRATARDGVTYAAGTPAAVVYGIVRTDGNSFGTTETISTYLDGVLQETGNADANTGVTSGERTTGRRAIGTNLPFDAIEFAYSQSGGIADVEVRVHEFCTSTN